MDELSIVVKYLELTIKLGNGHFVTRTIKRTVMQDKLFVSPKPTLKIQQQEADINSLLNEIKHVPHPPFIVMEGQQSDMHFASIPHTQREMRDNKVLNNMQDELGEDIVLILKDLNATTIAGTILTAIADSGVSLTCIQPTEE